MSAKNINKQPGPAKSEQNRRMAMLEDTLLEKMKMGAELQDSEKRYRRLFESAQDGILILDAYTGKIYDVNPCLIQLLGYSYDTLRGKHLWEIGALKDIAESKNAFKFLQDNEYIRYEHLPLETCDGKRVDVEFVSNVYQVDGHKVIQCNIRDITARKQVESERMRLIEAVEQATDAIVITDAEGNIQFVNPAFERTTGYNSKEALGRNMRIVKSGKQDDLFYRNLWSAITLDGAWEGRLVNKRKDGILYTEEMSISAVRDSSDRITAYVAIKRDITEQLRLTAQLQQAQKMDAVGVLAGGVAHDYNNMLTVILGFTELALSEVDPAQPLHADLEEIYSAAMRTADITRQLLAFARKQTIIPVKLDLNRNVENMLGKLRQQIGENIELIWLPQAGLSSVKMDPVQMEQVLSHLCLNAAESIADGGVITIETRSITLEKDYCDHHIGFTEGDYVLLAVSDDGCGMDRQAVDHIFEPFYTNKEACEGAGLGLSMVYGVVKQNNGFINAYSEPGKGTTIKIFLPRQSGQAANIQQREKTFDIPLSHGETVLVVEDEPSLLAMSKLMLEKIGYRALAANAPNEAIELLKVYASDVQLLITDVVMPEMDGRDLAERLHALHPYMRILYMFGYTAEVVIQQGMLDEDMSFIQKPFSMKELANKVRETLNGN